jgi:acetylornithine deacetylase/succinyl-diaminopimelate desuccinylase-like protein
VLPGPDGILRAELRAGVTGAPESERARWSGFAPGEKFIKAAGGRLLYPQAGDRYYEQNFWEPSLDVDEIHSGSPRTVIPCEAFCFVSVRLAPSQDNHEIIATLERLLLENLPDYAELSFIPEAGCDATSFDPELPALRAARKAFARVGDGEPDLMHIGGTLPLMDVLAKRNIPTILTGFASGLDKIHGPDESYRLEALTMGAAAGRALFEELAQL